MVSDIGGDGRYHYFHITPDQILIGEYLTPEEAQDRQTEWNNFWPDVLVVFDDWYYDNGYGHLLPPPPI